MLVEIWYAALNADGTVAQFEMEEVDGEGPNMPFLEGAFTYVQLAGRPSPGPQPTPSSVLRLVDGAPAWGETAPLADVIASSIAQIDSAADAARLEVLSRQTNTEEYKRAEQQARGYRVAGYPPDDVPSCVASWTKAKWRDEWTAQQAADDIIATADRWYGLLDAIRELRLCAKEDVRHAADSGKAASRVQQFSTDLNKLMKGSS